MAEQNSFPSSAFQLLSDSQDIQVISRPSLSYWQDAWLRLKANRRALISLYLVLGLLLFTFFGPILWDVDLTGTRGKS
jgi:oligopeptide transport system permease protein